MKAKEMFVIPKREVEFLHYRHYDVGLSYIYLEVMYPQLNRGEYDIIIERIKDMNFPEAIEFEREVEKKAYVKVFVNDENKPDMDLVWVETKYNADYFEEDGCEYFGVAWYFTKFDLENALKDSFEHDSDIWTEL